MNVFLPMSVAFIVAAIYAIIVHVKAPSETWGWWHSLIATLVSILLGVTIALSLFHAERHAVAKAEKQRFLSLIELELSGIRHTLLDTTRINISVHSGAKLQAQETYIQPLVLEKAGLSGLFSDGPSFMMINLSGSMRMFNKKSQVLLDLLGSSKNPIELEANVRSAIEEIDRSRGGILNGIDLLCRDLDIQLRDNISVY